MRDLSRERCLSRCEFATFLGYPYRGGPSRASKARAMAGISLGLTELVKGRVREAAGPIGLTVDCLASCYAAVRLRVARLEREARLDLRS
jgi:hypothetical protein